MQVDELVPLGTTAFKPETYFLYHPSTSTTAELTPLQQSEYYLLAASKTYRLLKQSEDGQTTRQNSLSKLTDFLEDRFTHFQLTVDYTHTVTDQQTGIPQETEPLAEETQQLLQERENLLDKIDNLEHAVEHGFEHLEQELQTRLEHTIEEYETVENQLQELEQLIHDEKTRLRQWRNNGQSLAYLFTYTTQPRLIHHTRLAEEVGEAIEAAQDHGHSIQQTLRGPNMQIYTEEMTEPRISMRREHTSLHIPEYLEDLTDEPPPELEDSLEQLRAEQMRQYIAYSPIDLETDQSGRFERKKQTPGKAVQTLLHKLNTVPQLNTSNDIPGDGPIIGTAADTEQVVGINPADYRRHDHLHYYIVGGTGAGKTYLKRVLLENAASLGYNILIITPSDPQTLGLNHPYQRHSQPSHATGLDADQYLADDPRLLDPLEAPVEELTSGINAVTLQGLSETETKNFVHRVLTYLNDNPAQDTPLFIGVDEAHRFAEGETLEIIGDIAREARKNNVKLVFATQEPNDFGYSKKGTTTRNQLNHVFMKGKFTNYADQHLEPDFDITQLDSGQAIFYDWNHEPVVVNVREPLTHIIEEDLGDEPGEYIDKIQEKYSAEMNVAENLKQRKTNTRTGKQDTDTAASLETSGTVELGEKEEAVLNWIQSFHEENSEWPTSTQTHKKGPASAGNYKEILQTLQEKGLITETQVERNNGTYTGYKTQTEKPPNP
jgi:hypothetical protein